MTDGELVAQYDSSAQHAPNTLKLYRDELMRRELRKSAEAAYRLARTNMTVAIVAAIAAVLALALPLAD